MTLKNKYFTISEAARESEVTRQTISRWVREGKLPAEKIGRETLIKKVDLRKQQISLLAADEILKVITGIMNDYCHTIFDIGTDKRVSGFEKRKGKYYLKFSENNLYTNDVEIPTSFEKFYAGFAEYAQPILAKFLGKLMPVFKDILSHAIKDDKKLEENKQKIQVLK
jgi:excisionase family DNA binding protein